MQHIHVNVYIFLCLFVQKMSSELYTVSGPGGNNASLQGTTVGGSKPLHRFIRGQPKIIGVRHTHMYHSIFQGHRFKTHYCLHGHRVKEIMLEVVFVIFSQIIVLVLGSSFFILSVSFKGDFSYHHIWTIIPPGFLLGTLVGSTTTELLISINSKIRFQNRSYQQNQDTTDNKCSYRIWLKGDSDFNIICITSVVKHPQQALFLQNAMCYTTTFEGYIIKHLFSSSSS